MAGYKAEHGSQQEGYKKVLKHERRATAIINKILNNIPFDVICVFYLSPILILMIQLLFVRNHITFLPTFSH
jgi:hypothetical protein